MTHFIQHYDPLRARATLITIFCTWIAFVVAGLGFGKMTEYDDFSEAASAHAALGASFTIIVIGAYLALALVLIGGLPLAFVAFKQALRARQWRTLLLFSVPPLSLAVWAGWTLLLVNVISPNIQPHPAVHSPLNILFFNSLTMLFILAAITSTVAVCRAIQRSQISPNLYRFALAPAALATLVMAVVASAMLVWGLTLWAAAPDLFTGPNGILATPTAFTWASVAVIMALSTIIAIAAFIRHLPKQPALQQRLA